MNELITAQTVAKIAHYGQLRKYTDDPYITHPIQVKNILLNTYSSVTVPMLKAALLHDTVEDTVVTLGDIKNIFGYEVSSLVYWLTDISKPENGNRATRKAIDREHIAKAPVNAQIIKCADLIHNTESIVQYDKKFAKIYMKEKRLLLDCMKHKTKKTDTWKRANQICENYKSN